MNEVSKEYKSSGWNYTIAVTLTAVAGHIYKHFDTYYFGDNKHRHFLVPMLLDVVLLIISTRIAGRLARRLGKRIDGWLAALFSPVIYSLLSAPVFVFYRYYFTPVECYAIFMMPVPCAKPTYENIVIYFQNLLTISVITFLIGTALYKLLMLFVQKFPKNRVEKKPA